jgi:hypothetical protein
MCKGSYPFVVLEFDRKLYFYFIDLKSISTRKD